MTDRRTFLAGLAGTGFVALAGCTNRGETPPPLPPGRNVSSAPPAKWSGQLRVAGTIADGLNVPWGLVFLPDGRALVAQRDAGSIAVVDPKAAEGKRVKEFGSVRGAVGRPGGEGGVLGLALDPDDDNGLFVFVTTAQDERIVRFEFGDDGLGASDVVLDGIPAGQAHHGGRMAFGPDGYLYVCTGEAARPQRAQDKDALGGKILRITKDGKPAEGNPFDNEVWSWGHRNPEGLAFDADGRLWACEFGAGEVDELNLIEKGANYGWPEFEGESDDPRFVTPKVTWPVADCSPSGMAITRSTAFVAALRGARLWTVPLNGADAGEPEAHFVGEYGRLRTVEVGPDGDLWLTTSNSDGRGSPRDGDDRILRVILE